MVVLLVCCVTAVVVSPVLLGVARPVADALAEGAPVRLPPLRRWVALATVAPMHSALAAAAALAVSLRWASVPAAAVVAMACLAVGSLAALVDRRCHRLPDVLVLPLGVASLSVAAGWSLATAEGTWLAAGIVGAVVAATLLGVGWVVGMGLGDVKFGAALAVLVGWPAGSLLGAVTAALALVGLACAGAASWWAVVALLRRRAPRWFPFGPFLAAAALCGVLVVGPPTPGRVDLDGEPVRPAWAGHR